MGMLLTRHRLRGVLPEQSEAERLEEERRVDAMFAERRAARAAAKAAPESAPVAEAKLDAPQEARAGKRR
jgi:hypothetical protein